MKIIHLNYSDINGGAARAAYRVHNSLIKDKIDLNSNFCLQVGTLNKEYNLTEYCLIHQYDRNPSINQYVVNQYL